MNAIINPFHRLWANHINADPFIQLKGQMKFTRDDEPREKSPAQLLECDPPGTMIPMPDKSVAPIEYLEITTLEKGINPNEKSKSKTPKKKPRKNNSRANKQSVEKVQG